MGYFQWESADPKIFNKETLQTTNSAEDAEDFKDWIWQGIKEAFQIGKNCTGTTMEKQTADR